MSRRLILAVETLSRACGAISALLLIVAMVIMCQMILMRYLFKSPTIWQTEVVVFSATAAIFIGAPYVLMKKGHVGVDVVELLLSSGKRRWLRLLSSLLGLLFCALMSIASAIYVFEAWEGGWTTPTITAIPLWIPATPMLVGFALLCLQYVVEIIKLWHPEEEPAPTLEHPAPAQRDDAVLHPQPLGDVK
ncbi:TRAP transporter small permease subunit [Pseudomonas sp.]|uniref:TRAP transporter small permease subunit n=1 Tax=Pseudomonas sp. TaxID=306 RepID=UPI002CA25B9D|nr:TRAP transporter small permease [Pseudomonas sp.]